MAYELENIYVDVVDDGQRRRAIKVCTSDGNYFWLPKSQIKKSIHISGRTYRLVIPRWLAKQKGIV